MTPLRTRPFKPAFLTHFMLLSMLLVTSLCRAGDFSKAPHASVLIKKLADQGMNAAWVTVKLQQAKRQQSIIDAMSHPAEKRLDWGQYRAIFITKRRVMHGLSFWQQHHKTLQRAEKTFGVPAPIILAILGVETDYARNTGNYRVLDALATLGFDYPPRGKFFRKELENFFLLSKDAHINISKVKGSYAGAIGMPQFMPSSYRHYGVDFDKDGRIDLVNSAADAIGSIANYFVQHGWQKGLPIAARAKVKGSQWVAIVEKAGLKPSMTLTEAQQAGINAVHCKTNDPSGHYCFKKLPADTPVAPLELDGKNGNEYWLATNNFYVITRYNHSALYAMAVFQLASKLQLAHKEQP